MNRLQRAWERLSPNHQQRWIRLLIGSILLGGILLVAALMPNPKPLEDRQTIVNHLLTDADTRVLGMEGIAAGVRQSKRDQDQMEKRIVALEELARLSRSTKGNDPPASDPLDQDQEAHLKSAIDTLKKDLEDFKNEYRTRAVATTSNGDTANVQELPLPLMPQRAIKTSPWERPSRPRESWGSASEQPRPLGDIKVLRNHVANDKDLPLKGSHKAADLFIPAGTLLSGQLLNGLDAPTGKGSRKEPFPVLVRIKHEAILPNRFRADLRECFLLAAGYGDLSAERAYLRAETFSCVRQDGGVLEVPLDAYAVGEDGKLGLRGNVISKQGQLMAQSLIAGFAQGVSEAFGRVQIPVVMNGGSHQISSNVPYQNSYSEAALQGGAMRGAGSAMDRMANYYMDLSETLFPVIEIDVTRHIEFIVQRGTTLKVATGKVEENHHLQSH